MGDETKMVRVYFDFIYEGRKIKVSPPGGKLIPVGRFTIYDVKGGCTPGNPEGGNGRDQAIVEANESGQIRAGYKDSCRSAYEYGKWVGPTDGLSSATQLIGDKAYTVNCQAMH